jgi:hypothetical protein
MSSIKSDCKRLFTQRKSKQADIVYQRPVSKTDLKREGRFLMISTKQGSVKLSGAQINSLKDVLQDVGETGRKRINHKRVRVGIL